MERTKIIFEEYTTWLGVWYVLITIIEILVLLIIVVTCLVLVFLVIKGLKRI